MMLTGSWEAAIAAANQRARYLGVRQRVRRMRFLGHVLTGAPWVVESITYPPSFLSQGVILHTAPGVHQ